MIHDLLFRLRVLCRRRAAEAELDAELQAHLEHQAEKYMSQGLSPDEAERRARFDFGDVEQVKEECRHSWGVPSAGDVMAGLHNGFRLVRRSPGFTAAAAAALVVGFVFNMAMFSDASAVVQQLSPQADSAHPVLAARNITPRPAVVSDHSPAFVGPKAPPPAKVRVSHKRLVPVPIVRRTPAFLPVTIVTVSTYRYQSPGVRVEETVWTTERGAEIPSRLALASERLQQTRPAAGLAVLLLTVRFTRSGNTVLEVLPANSGHPQEDAWRSRAHRPSAAPSDSTQGRTLTASGQPDACTSVSQSLSNL